MFAKHHPSCLESTWMGCLISFLNPPISPRCDPPLHLHLPFLPDLLENFPDGPCSCSPTSFTSLRYRDSSLLSAGQSVSYPPRSSSCRWGGLPSSGRHFSPMHLVWLFLEWASRTALLARPPQNTPFFRFCSLFSQFVTPCLLKFFLIVLGPVQTLLTLRRLS